MRRRRASSRARTAGNGGSVSATSTRNCACAEVMTRARMAVSSMRTPTAITNQGSVMTAPMLSGGHRLPQRINAREPWVVYGLEFEWQDGGDPLRET